MTALTEIATFEVPPAADATFVAQWERGGSALHRALRTDVPLRFVGVAREPAESAAVLPFASHRALYEVVREAGDPDGAGGVLLIWFFEVPAGGDERFSTGWERVHELFAARQGWLGARLHRSPGAAEFRYVSIARWSSPLMYARALQQPELASAVAALPFPGHPALYLPVGA